MSKNAEKSYEDLVAEQVKALQVPEKFQLTALAVDQNLPKLCHITIQYIAYLWRIKCFHKPGAGALMGCVRCVSLLNFYS